MSAAALAVPRPDDRSSADGRGGVADALAELLHADTGLRERLERSLRLARERAQAGIRPELFAALPWPTDAEAYVAYVRDFARYVPRQTPREAWRSADGGDAYEEVHDRMVHFYWLVDQGADGPGAADVVQADARFAAWLLRFARAWGDFLDSPASLTPETLASFREHAPDYELAASELPEGGPITPSGWRSFNQLFARSLPAGARPIAEPHANAAITFPADAALEACFEIAADGSFPAITVKHSHAYADVATLLGVDDALAARFRGGRACHVHLKPYAYHRFHTPVAGRAVAVRHLEGRAYLKTGIEDGKLEGFNDATNGYEFAQQRGVLVLDTAGDPCGDVGLVACVPVGMGHVSSVRVTVAEGARLAKGSEFGHFLYGGSDVVLLFEPRAAVEVLAEPKAEGRVGEVLGRARR